FVDCRHPVVDGYGGELFAMAGEKRLRADDESACSQFDHLCEDTFEVTFAAGIEDMELQPKGVSCRQHLTCVGLRKIGRGWVDKERHDVRRGRSSCSNSSIFGVTSWTIWVAPLMLPPGPGRRRLATRPGWIGSEPTSNTIGMVVVAAFAATAAGVLVAAITDT